MTKKKQLSSRKIFWSSVFALVFGGMFWWAAYFGPKFYANNEISWWGIAMVMGAVSVCGLAAVLLSLGFKLKTTVCLLIALALLTAFRITILVMAVVYLAFLIYGYTAKAFK